MPLPGPCLSLSHLQPGGSLLPVIPDQGQLRFKPDGLVPPAPLSCWTLQECSHFADREAEAQVGEGGNAANQA